jgi:hypothetical protein
MFDFLNGIYCTLIGWFITPESCDDLNTRLSFKKQKDVEGYIGGKHNKTKKHRKHKTNIKNKTQSNKNKYFIF